MRRSYTAGIIFVGLFSAACDETPTGPTVRESATPPQVSGATPSQMKIARALAERSARGERTPIVSYEFESAQGSSLFELENKRYAPGEGYSFTARTIIHYRGPADAGLERWPALRLSPEQSEKHKISDAEFQARYVTRLENAHPGFWQRNALGQEPRTYTITESGRTTYPTSSSTRVGMQEMLSVADATASATGQEDLVFGFSLNVPEIERSRSFGFQDVQEVEFSVDFLNWGIGFRLPVRGSLDGPEPMKEGSTYTATSAVEGLNYSGAQYAAVGLPAEDGDEAYFRMDIQGCVKLSGVIDSGRECLGPDIRRARSFTTPFGAGVDVNMPTVDLSIIDYGIAGIDLDINSTVGSDKITADWSVVGAARGSGRLNYTSPSSPRTLSGVQAIDGPGQALFSVDGFLYRFTHFTISPRARLWVDVEIPIPLVSDLEWEDSWSLGLGTYDLSDFIDHDFIDSDGASVGVHHNREYTGATKLGLSVGVLNVAPTAAIGLNGGEPLEFNGVLTIVGNTGENFTFTGTSHDPGRDGLTFSWDWGDGPPVPDQSTHYPLTGTAGPNNATDIRTHAFTRACLYDVTFTSVDDDNASGEDHVSILVTETGRSRRLEGYWQHQLGRNGGGLLEPSVISCYLAIVGRVSRIFSEVREASTPDAAYDVVHTEQNAGSERLQLDREILVAWLNFASGAISLAEQVDTNGDGVKDAQFHQVMQAAETLRLDASATQKALRRQTQVLHAVSVGR